LTDFEPLSPEAMEPLTADPGPWLSCDDCFDQLDVVVEAAVASPASLSQQFRAHFLGCAACGEEARSLAEAVAGDHQFSPAQARARLEAAILGAGV
jgi:hypothetical protein